MEQCKKHSMTGIWSLVLIILFIGGMAENDGIFELKTEAATKSVLDSGVIQIEECLKHLKKGTYQWDPEKKELILDYDVYSQKSVEIKIDEEIAGDPFEPDVEGESVSLQKNRQILCLQVKRLGKSKIKIMSAEGMSSFIVIIQKKISAGDIAWEKLETVVYAGERGQCYTLKGNYKIPDKIKNSTADFKIQAKAVLCDEKGKEVLVKAGTYQRMLLTEIIYENQEEVYLKLDRTELESYIVENTSGILTIQKKILYIKPRETNYSFTKEAIEVIRKQIAEKKNQVVLEDEKQVVSEELELVKAYLAELTLQIDIELKELKEGIYHQVIEPDLRDAALENYILICKEGTKADLIIKWLAIDGMKLLDLVEVEDSNYWFDGEKIWLQKAEQEGSAEMSGAYLRMWPKKDKEIIQEYEYVIFKEDEKEIDVTKKYYYSLREGKKQIQFYLKGKADIKTDTKTIQVHVDGAAPSVEFGYLKKHSNVMSDLLETIPFGIYQNNSFALAYSVSDKGGCGIDQSSYYIWDLSKENLTGGEISAKDIYEKITESENAVTWTALQEDAGSIPIPCANGKAYLVLIKTRDRVKNEKIYASNGIVLEHNSPMVSIDGLDTVNIYGKNSKVTFSVRASDGVTEKNMERNELGISGMDRLILEIFQDGRIEESKTYYADPNAEIFEETSAYAGERKLVDTVYAGETKIPEQEVYNTGILELEKSYSSNDIEIRATAYDRAGNYQTVSKHIKADRTKPIIQMSFSSNNAINANYFGSIRQAVITVTERNYLQATFDLIVEEGRDAGEYKNCTLEMLNQIEGIEIEYLRDSEGDREEKDYTDKRINKMCVIFSGDNVYHNFTVHCVDGAGNENEPVNYEEGTVAPKNFVIDTKAPMLIFTYYCGGKEIVPGKEEEKRIYQNKEITVRIEIVERNFAEEDQFREDQISYQATAYDGQKHHIPIPNYEKQAFKKENWSRKINTWSSQYLFRIDGNYKTCFSYTDLAGHTATRSMDFFTVDTKGPMGRISIGACGFWEKLYKKIIFNNCDNRPQEITLTGTDAISPVKTISYMTSRYPLTKREVKSQVKWKKGKSLKKSANEQFIVYSKVEDQAGNIAYFSSQGVILDYKAPKLDIAIEEAEQGIYSGDVAFTIRAEEPIAGDTYSGLQSISYEIFNGTRMTQSETFDVGRNSENRRVKKWNRDVMIDAQKNNSNHIIIRVTAQDRAGNTSVKTEKIRIDRDQPVITVSYNHVLPENGNFYKDTRVATVTVKERNFDSGNVKFDITNTNGGKPEISSWSSSSADEIYTCTVTFSEDGDYTFTMECIDLAGNKGGYGKRDSFTIDQSIPIMHISYDNQNVWNGHYYHAERTATIIIEEDNFNASNVKAIIQASLNGQAITPPLIGSFSSDGNVHTAVINYAVSGDYIFEISYMDMAGNYAEKYEGDYFTIDLEKPEIKIAGIKKANKDAVKPVAEVTDVNYDANVLITLTGTKHKSMELDGIHTPIRNGEQIHIADFAHTEDMDDIYTITVKAMDMAGNIAEKAYIFSINRFGSIYKIDSKQQEKLDKYYLNAEDMSVLDELIIEEINVDSLQLKKVICSKDGEMHVMEEGSHYTVEKSGTEEGWKIYTYHIYKENFTMDGKYTITIYSEDAAGNLSSTRSKNKIIEFVTDRTSPTIVLTGIEDKARYRQDQHSVTVDVKDNLYLKSLKIQINEGKSSKEQVYEFTEEQLQGMDGVVVQEIKSENRFQTVTATATDAAGNTYKTESIRVLITSNWFIQFYLNKPLFFCGLAAAFLLATKIFFSSKKI